MSEFYPEERSYINQRVMELVRQNETVHGTDVFRMDATERHAREARVREYRALAQQEVRSKKQWDVSTEPNESWGTFT